MKNIGMVFSVLLLLCGCGGRGGYMAAGMAQGMGDAISRDQQLQQPQQRYVKGLYEGQTSGNGLVYCSYSNGAILTINLSQICPLQIY